MFILLSFVSHPTQECLGCLAPNDSCLLSGHSSSFCPCVTRGIFSRFQSQETVTDRQIYLSKKKKKDSKGDMPFLPNYLCALEKMLTSVYPWMNVLLVDVHLIAFWHLKHKIPNQNSSLSPLEFLPKLGVDPTSRNLTLANLPLSRKAMEVKCHFAEVTPMLVRALQRNRAIGDICMELAHVIVGVRKSEVCRAGQQARNAGKSWHCTIESTVYRAGH